MSSAAFKGTTTTHRLADNNGDSTKKNTSNSYPTKGVQWEVPLVDEYLFSLLIPSLQRALGTLMDQPKSPLSSRSLLALLSAFTIYMTRGQTPAVQALGWRVVETQQQQAAAVTQHGQQPTSALAPSRRSVVFYILCSVLLPTLYQKFQDWYREYLLNSQINNNRNVINRNNNNNNNNDSMLMLQQQQQQQQQQLARQRQLRLLHFLSTWLRRSLAMARLLLWLSPAKFAFTQSPRLSMVLTGLQYTYQQPQQYNNATDLSSSSISQQQSFPYHVTYGHRRWLYEEMCRFLAIAAPVASWHEGQELVTLWIMQPWTRTWRQLVRRIRSHTPTSVESSGCCPICHLDPIVVPCQTNCGCPQRYCYTCLWQEMYDITNACLENNPTMNRPTFTCHECQHPFTSVQRWSSSSSI